MWISIFFDKKCSIYSISYVRVDWSQIPQKTLLYENIDCDFWKTITQWNFWPELPERRQEDMENMKLILNWPNFTDVRKEMYVDLFEAWNVPVWTFIIKTVDFVKDIYGVIDNVYMSCETTDDAD